jgi:hypothetical protein
MSLGSFGLGEGTSENSQAIRRWVWQETETKSVKRTTEKDYWPER